MSNTCKEFHMSATIYLEQAFDFWGRTTSTHYLDNVTYYVDLSEVGHFYCVLNFHSKSIDPPFGNWNLFNTKGYGTLVLNGSIYENMLPECQKCRGLLYDAEHLVIPLHAYAKRKIGAMV